MRYTESCMKSTLFYFYVIIMLLSRKTEIALDWRCQRADRFKHSRMFSVCDWQQQIEGCYVIVRVHKTSTMSMAEGKASYRYSAPCY